MRQSLGYFISKQRIRESRTVLGYLFAHIRINTLARVKVRTRTDARTGLAGACQIHDTGAYVPRLAYRHQDKVTLGQPTGCSSVAVCHSTADFLFLPSYLLHRCFLFALFPTTRGFFAVVERFVGAFFWQRRGRKKGRKFHLPRLRSSS